MDPYSFKPLRDMATMLNKVLELADKQATIEQDIKGLELHRQTLRDEIVKANIEIEARKKEITAVDEKYAAAKARLTAAQKTVEADIAGVRLNADKEKLAINGEIVAAQHELDGLMRDQTAAARQLRDTQDRIRSIQGALASASQ